ncbi:PREDICTED: uncharacterized protein LOC106740693 [Dinoponera quadriceps]|uniref:Uncharacterized protein LOC106740693 n=1 Tax=Dinoponera quadriceps TaxID=609295 RepID=A0A6P3WNN6_DINQU|nr:PREDICTED: uncharacterized protein LOC106740693 [Dinoponera quadriceps]XP_014467462.1 PREDICTED: uncharacterized protein LOC106740693 [Dinoponera quadriceps]
MSKSPINILQEILVKEGYAPKYFCSFDAFHFKCEVTCKNLSASGTGTNKKEAKHNAALNMLSLLNVDLPSKGYQTENSMQSLKLYQTMNINQSNDISSPSNISSPAYAQMYPECNYVGLLQELCVQYRLDLPIYELVSESGPSHMKTFTIKSNIGCLNRTGIAHCKRSAKQEAAKNALQYLIALNKLPEEACKKVENYRKIFQDNSQDITTGISNIKITGPVSSVVVPEIAVVSDKRLASCIEPIFNNIAKQNVITVDSSAGFNNNNNSTVKTAHINSYKAKSDAISGCKNTSENNLKTFAMEKLIVEPTFTKQSGSAQSSHVESNGIKEQNLVVKNDRADLLSSVLINNDKGCRRTTEDDLRDIFDIEILDHIENKKSVPPLTELSKNALTTYSSLSGDAGRHNPANTYSHGHLTDCHILFKKNYSSKISDDLKIKMRSVTRLSNLKSPVVQETCQDVKKALGVKLKEFNLSTNCKTDIAIVLRMESTPVIAQFGTGSTESEARARAMLALINTILDYLK